MNPLFMLAMKHTTAIFPLVFLFSLLVLPFSTEAATLTDRLSGRVLLAVEDKGEAWYIDPTSKERIYVKDGPTAFALLRSKGLGVSEKDFSRIEQHSVSLWKRLSGRIILRVEQHGEAYYLEPVSKKVVYLSDGLATFQLLRTYGLGIKTLDLSTIPVQSDSQTPDPAPNQLTSEDTLDLHWQQLVNDRRSSFTLSRLASSSELEQSAAVWVKHLAGLQTISHTRPGNLSLSAWAEGLGVSLPSSGTPGSHVFSENLGMIVTGTSQKELLASLDTLFSLMLKDPSGHHYQTIHDKAWDRLGSAFYLTPRPDGTAMLYGVFHYAQKAP